VKAIVYTKYGTPEVLRLQEVPQPVPREDEALVAVRAASVNSWDWDLLRGVPSLLRVAKPQHPILGADIAGTVVAVGRKTGRLQPGDEVFGDLSGCGWGGFAEYVCAREEVLAPKSPGMTFEQAAAIPQAGVLALQGLRDKGRIRGGHQVLVNGAGGGVGTFAVQLARSFGAEVTGVDRADKLPLLRSLGAHRVIDYALEDFTLGGPRYDVVLDVAARHSAFQYSRALNPGGSCVIVGGSGAAVFQALLFGPWISLTAGKRIGLLLHRPNRGDLEFLRESFEAGAARPVIDRSYPLSEVAEALRYLGEGRAKGKVIITVGHD
jgi:NADPH:quinone reductase-like Zn-dependent oxidoreductase